MRLLPWPRTPGANGHGLPTPKASRRLATQSPKFCFLLFCCLHKLLLLQLFFGHLSSFGTQRLEGEFGTRVGGQHSCMDVCPPNMCEEVFQQVSSGFSFCAYPPQSSRVFLLFFLFVLKKQLLRYPQAQTQAFA